MSLITRFLTAFTGEDRGSEEPPGLVEDQTGSIYLIRSDGTRVLLASGGGSQVTDGVLTGILAQVPTGTLADLGGGEVGLGLVVQRLGPFRVNWDSADVTVDPGAFLTSLAADVFVIRAAAMTVAPFTASGPFTYVALSILVAGDQLITYDVNGAHPPLAGVTREAIQDINVSTEVALTTDVVDATAWLDTDGVPTAGAADVYLIVASPAT